MRCWSTRGRPSRRSRRSSTATSGPSIRTDGAAGRTAVRVRRRRRAPRPAPAARSRPLAPDRRPSRLPVAASHRQRPDPGQVALWGLVFPISPSNRTRHPVRALHVLVCDVAPQVNPRCRPSLRASSAVRRHPLRDLGPIFRCLLPARTLRRRLARCRLRGCLLRSLGRPPSATPVGRRCAFRVGVRRRARRGAQRLVRGCLLRSLGRPPSATPVGRRCALRVGVRRRGRGGAQRLLKSRLRNSWGLRLGAVLNSPGEHAFALGRRLDAGSGGPAARRELEVGLFRRLWLPGSAWGVKSLTCTNLGSVA